MKKVAALLFVLALVSVSCLMLVSPVKGALPSPLIIAALIIATVAVFGTILSFCLRK
jgi:hypothetical protein